MTRPVKQKSLKRIRRAIDRIPEVKGTGTDAPAFSKWRRDTEIAIANTFVDSEDHVERFQNVGYYPDVILGGGDRADYRGAFEQGLQHAEALLESMAEEIEEYWEDEHVNTFQAKPERPVASNDVFIAHGHSATKDTVARFLERLGLNPIILEEQPSQGRTIIEKFERHAEVGFAVAILTPDDEGRVSGSDNLRPRARQNVIFELGFFLGKLGRSRVCALKDGHLESPSDYDGVVYISIDGDDGWKFRLARELHAAGLAVDLSGL
ncbi:MAG: hypothetical protein F4Y16_03060 [Holophagales bacterium]|nr:hypothetical protein [Holophagales bacterium]MYH24920.1 hypothetical protein [Holophagales bacterium]